MVCCRDSSGDQLLDPEKFQQLLGRLPMDRQQQIAEDFQEHIHLLCRHMIAKADASGGELRVAGAQETSDLVAELKSLNKRKRG